jgi:hypothetical protein
MFKSALEKEKSFSTLNLYVFENIKDFQVVCKRLGINTPFKPVSQTNTNKDNLKSIVERLAEIKEDIDKEEKEAGGKESAVSSSDEMDIDLSLSDDDDDDS